MKYVDENEKMKYFVDFRGSDAGQIQEFGPTKEDEQETGHTTNSAYMSIFINNCMLHITCRWSRSLTMAYYIMI